MRESLERIPSRPASQRSLWGRSCVQSIFWRSGVRCEFVFGEDNLNLDWKGDEWRSHRRRDVIECLVWRVCVPSYPDSSPVWMVSRLKRCWRHVSLSHDVRVLSDHGTWLLHVLYVVVLGCRTSDALLPSVERAHGCGNLRRNDVIDVNGWFGESATHGRSAHSQGHHGADRDWATIRQGQWRHPSTGQPCYCTQCTLTCSCCCCFQDLNCLIERYLEPLKEETFLSSDDVERLFGNIQEIVQFQKLFLQSLEQAAEVEQHVSIFSEGHILKVRVFFNLDTLLFPKSWTVLMIFNQSISCNLMIYKL